MVDINVSRPEQLFPVRLWFFVGSDDVVGVGFRVQKPGRRASWMDQFGDLSTKVRVVLFLLSTEGISDSINGEKRE
jgi:hypothetical protein